MRNLFLLCFLLFPLVVSAQIPTNGAVLNPVPLMPSAKYDFTTGTLPAGTTYSRASTGWYFNSSGLLVSAATDVPRFDYGTPGSSTLSGLLVEYALTNTVLWNRDFTNIVWTPTNITPALDQIGIDGVSNSASSLTATSSNGTICQTVTLASTSISLSMYVKRLTGSGTISLAQDGSTYTTITTDGTWKRFLIARQTVVNPVVCVKIATSGDAVAVDIAQLDKPPGGNNATYSSPIPTTSSPVTRAIDNLSVPGSLPWINLNSGAFIAEWMQPNTSSCGRIMSFGGSGMGVSINNGNISTPFDAGGSTICGNVGSLFTTGIIFKSGATYGTRFFKAATNGTACTPSSANPSSLTSLGFGNGTCGLWVRKFTYWPYPLTAAQIQAQTL